MSTAALATPFLVRGNRPATVANIARNAAGADGDRARRWESARTAAWQLLERHVPHGARVAVIGAGNGDDLPLRALAARAEQLDLIDLDPAALQRARRACPPELRSRIRLRREDVTGGAADRVAQAARLGRPLHTCKVPEGALGPGGYDVVVGDLFYSQLLYPALLDAGMPPSATRRVLARHGPGVTDAVVARMHASVTPGGRIIHLHDAVGWWNGHPQPVSLAEILNQDHSEAALSLISLCQRPRDSDPREAAQRRSAHILETVLWEWPFAAGASYLVCATVTAAQPGEEQLGPPARDRSPRTLIVPGSVASNVVARRGRHDRGRTD